MIQGSPGPEIDVVSGIELEYSYELGSDQTRIRVLTRPRWGLGMVMTKPCASGTLEQIFPCSRNVGTVMTVPNPHLGLVNTLILVQPLPSS